MNQETLSKGERTRAGIIQVANKLFVEHGYHGTSMRQIAKEAAIALGGIYNHFDSKEAIFLAVLETYHPYHTILPILQNAQGETVEAFVQSAAAGMVAALDKHPGFLNLMFIEIVEFGSQHIPQMFQTYFPQVMSIVQRFEEEQANIRLIPLAAIIRIFIGLFISYYVMERLIGEHLPEDVREGAMEHTVDVFLHGIVS